MADNKEFVYVVIMNGELFIPNAFTTYENALDAVKETLDDLHDNEENDDWRDNEENEVDVDEGHKMGKKRNEDPNKDPNVTELYVEKAMNINIYKLEVKFPKAIIPTLKSLSLGVIKKHNLTPKNETQRLVLEEKRGGTRIKRAKKTKRRRNVSKRKHIR